MEKATLTRLYWTGPYNVLVPCGTKWVSACDGGNTWSRDGFVTEMAIFDKDGTYVDSLGKAAYMACHAKEGDDGNYYYITRDTANCFDYDGNTETEYYWVGPHGILVPSHIPSVKAMNGVDTHHSDGSITRPDPLTREQYMATYGLRYEDDDVWYYNQDRRCKRPCLEHV